MTPSVVRASAPGFLLCLTYHLPNISGLTLSAHEIARYLVSCGYPVRIITGKVPETAASRECIDGIDVRRVSSIFKIGKALVMPGYALEVWRALDGVDAVSIHLPCLDAAAVAILTKLRRRKLIVSYISSMSRRTMPDRIMRMMAAIPHMIAGALADKIQVVSVDYAEASTFCRLFSRKLDPAPLPVHLHLFPDESYPPRKPRIATPDAPFRIGYVGRIARQKSLEVLFDAFPVILEQLGNNAVIDLVGPASDVIGESYWQDILKTATASGGSIRYIGAKAGRDLAQVYAGLDVLVLPSVDRLESYGLVQVEAMLRRVPVVASDLPGMRIPIMVSRMGRLFTAGDPKALAAAVVDILRNGPENDPGPIALEQMFGNAVACRPYLSMLNAEAAKN
jgi:glycosyltransferase involved in cell wall biosynthesis